MSIATESKTRAAVHEDDARLWAPSSLSVSGMSMADILVRLKPSRARKAIEIVEWLCRVVSLEQPGNAVEDLCERLVAAGLPLDRYSSSTSMVTADHDAVGRLWLRGKGATESVYVHTEEQDPVYLASPYFLAAQTGQWVECWIPETADDRFGIVPTLKELGITHYLCVPMVLTNGANAWTTYATREEAGFSEQDLLLIAFITPALTTRIDGRLGWSTLDKLLRTYVGDEPHRAILAGRAKRGQVSTIRAAMLVADLRDSTGHTADLSAVQAVDLFNNLFDCLVPSIEDRRGEVLKYLGDGLLAIFREAKERRCDASERALQAAEAALAAIRAFNAAHPGERPLDVGIALHYGEIAYGNVGSGLRLDFTVVGRDVALASRIATMNGPLRQPLLLSATFVDHVLRPVAFLGAFPARGFAEPVRVFRPDGALE